jgi:NAD(P)-dependent dehydrogenase (short-subunit alcohol dehydrogenase family)
MGTQDEGVTSDGLSGAVALITGGAGAVAKAIATRLGSRGAAVCLSDVEDSSKNADAVSATGAVAISVRGDVSSEEDVARAFEEAEAQLGTVTVLVNAAAIALPIGPIIHYDRADWDRILTVNLTGTMLSMREALRRMYPRGAGSVVNVSSNVGKRGMPNMSAYVASKWAIIGLTQTAALESVKYGVRVNAVCPGPTPAPLLERTIGGLRRA